MEVTWNTMLLSNNLAGVGNYIEKVLNQLKELTEKNRFTLFGTDAYDYNKISFNDQVIYSNRIISSNKIFRIIWEQTVLPVKATRNEADILHCPAHVIPLFTLSSTKTVVTIHDLAFKLFPETFERTKKVYLNFIVPLSIKRADKVIAVSENTKQDIIKEYGISPDKIEVIYNGVDNKYKEINNMNFLNKTKRKYDLPDKFILYLGTLEPRKNIERLIRAYDRYLSDAQNSEVKLVIAGGKGWLYEDIFNLVKKKELESKVVFTGYIDEEDIVSLYNLAEVFVYPSLYEGFGLPPLEAMACGTPVITSDTSSLPEVVGEAGIAVDPYNIEGLTKRINQVLLDGNLRKKLEKKGLERVKKFSWKRTAQQTLKLYKKIYNNKGREK